MELARSHEAELAFGFRELKAMNEQQSKLAQATKKLVQLQSQTKNLIEKELVEVRS